VLPRLVATDLDGTLLRDDGTIDARTRSALAAVRAAGTHVVVCTARPARWIERLVCDAGIAGPAVCANGAVLYDVAADTLLAHFPIAPEAALAVVQRLRAVVPDGAFAVEWPDRFGHEPAYVTRWPLGDDTVVDHVEALLATPPIKLLLRGAPEGDGPDVLVARARDAVGHLVEITHSSSSDTLLEMSALGVSKGSGLAALCAQRGIDAADVIAFGDMPNDLPMLAWAGCGVAMANAHPAVLAAADEVTTANEQGGVAAVLEARLRVG
jgi:hydroxymethylpyrimidine pyrophosphatase-like HAD family hydrolase